jgi:RHS repeat-associated protein
MAGKSAGLADLISRPSGGGAVQGIGEKFAPDLFTGTGNFSIPLAIPPGRNGLQPQLALSYSTGQGNGPFGLGFDLGVPDVRRKTSSGVPRYRDSSGDLARLEARDVFVLSGAEDLVPVTETPVVTTYRPRTEGLFARIEHHHDPARRHDFWRVHTRSGHVHTYGTPGAAGSDPAALADPRRGARVFRWALARSADPFGNVVDYEYLRDEDRSEPRPWTQLYVRAIRYADVLGGDGALRFLVSVTCDYAARPDTFSSHRPGFEIRTRLRCTRIEVRTDAHRPRLVKTYRLVYLDERVEQADREATMPPNRVSLLRRVEVTGHNGAATQDLPPLEFSYSTFDVERRDLREVTGPDLPPASLGNGDYELIDVYGRGLPDIVELGTVARIWRNAGGGRFDVPRPMPDAPAGITLSDPGVQLIDADGDGRADLLLSLPEISGYYPLSFDGAWDRRSFRRYRWGPSFSLEDPEVRLVDLDGDGISDAIRSGERMECYFNDAEHGWDPAREQRVHRGPPELFPDVAFSDPRVKWSDLTGDGLQDVVLVHDGSVEYWPSLGHGDWGARVTMRASPRLPRGYDPRRILLGDVDGDGFADLVYVDDTHLTVWINRGGVEWSAPIGVSGTPALSDFDAVRMVDLLGVGTAGVLWSTGVGRHRMVFLDLTGGTKPYLLHAMDNHRGAVTRVTYAPSTRFLLADDEHPHTRWRTPLPFPVQVVARVEVVDAVSEGRLTTAYRYHDGYWDGVEREFRGFGRVDQTDTEGFERYRAATNGDGTVARHAPPILTRTWFHQGPLGEDDEPDSGRDYWTGDPPGLARSVDQRRFLGTLGPSERRQALRALRGRVLRSETYALDGGPRQDRPYTVVEELHEVSPLPVGQPWDVRGEPWRHRVFFPHRRASRTTDWERGDDPKTAFSFTGGHDPYGQPRSHITIAVPRGRDFRVDLPVGAPAEPYLATRTTTEYARRDDAGRYLVDRVAATTTHEIVNDGRLSAPALAREIEQGRVASTVTAQTLSFYDGPAFTGRAFGEIGDHGAVMRRESLVLTEEALRDAYRSGAAPLEPPEAPPFMAHAAPPAEYPAEFVALLPLPAGLDPTRPGLAITPSGHGWAAAAPFARGYFVAAERREYDLRRGLVRRTRDALGRDTLLQYDAYDLLPVAVTTPSALTTSAAHDYRVLQPERITDPNGNRHLFTYSPLGLLESTSVLGKPAENVGDTPAAPGTRYVYDLTHRPLSIRTIQRVHHASDGDVPPAEREQTLERVEYSDGFGRVVQVRSQAEDVIFGEALRGGEALAADPSVVPGDAAGRARPAGTPPGVVVSGWQVYDNKGRVVERFEPFFSSGWAYAPPAERDRGQRITLSYDARGRMVRALHPNGAEERIVHGVPLRLDTPDDFRPTPWETYTYDGNDNAGRTHPVEAGPYAAHWNTPSSVLVDALDRTVESVARGGPAATDRVVTRLTYDIRGHVLSVTDALGRVAWRYAYDFAGRALRTESLDGGVRRVALDAAGNILERRDAKGALVLAAFDVAGRPIRLWARDAAGEPVTLRERVAYGDGTDSGLTRAQAAAANLLGRPCRHFDEAGLVVVDAVDFKGNVVEKTRRVLGDDVVVPAGAPTAYRTDWQPPPGVALDAHAAALLEATEYRTSTRYDALNRLVSLRLPQDVAGARRTLRPRYNGAGALEHMRVDDVVYVDRIAYNARGQRTLVALGNGVLTRYAYDAQTFRLVRLRSERFVIPAALTYRPSAPQNPLQDLAYAHDLAGNVTALHDRTPGGGVPNTPRGPDALDRRFTYDPFYRLTAATGRESDVPAPAPDWDDGPRPHDPNLTRAYREEYVYDAAGNVVELRHYAAGGGVVRRFASVPGRNRLGSLTHGVAVYAYAHDAAGNVTREGVARHLEWDHSDRLRAFRTQADAAPASMVVRYLYDSSGQRVKRLVRPQNGAVESTVFIDGIFEHLRTTPAGGAIENNTLHVMDDRRRIALVRVGPARPGDGAPAVAYQVADHLGGSAVVVDEHGAWIRREEFTPFGETSFGGFTRKRYRFAGQERDEQSGLTRHGARWCAPWLARWTSVDPAGRADGDNPYVVTRNNPLTLVDPWGRGSGGPDDDAPDAMKKLERELTADPDVDRLVADELARDVPDPDLDLDRSLTSEADSLTRRLDVAEQRLERALRREAELGPKRWWHSIYTPWNRKLAERDVKRATELLARQVPEGDRASVVAERTTLIKDKIATELGEADLNRRLADAGIDPDPDADPKDPKDPKGGPKGGGGHGGGPAGGQGGGGALGQGKPRGSLPDAPGGKKLLKGAVGWAGDRVLKSVPLVGGGWTFYSTEGGFWFKAVNTVAGEFGVGPFDLQLVGEAIGYGAHLFVETIGKAESPREPRRWGGTRF